MRAVALEPLGHFLEDVADVRHMDHWAVLGEDFNEAAHVGALEMVRQVHGHLQGRHGALNGVVLVAHLHRIAERLHAHAVDRNPAVVAFALGVFQHVSRSFAVPGSTPKAKKSRAGGRRLVFSLRPYG